MRILRLALRYPLKDVAKLLGQTPARVRRLASEAGLVEGAEGYSFQDLVILRSLTGVSQSVAPGKLGRALRRLRDTGAGDLPSLRFTTQGNQVVVRDQRGLYDPLSGQRLLDFAATQPPPAEITALPIRQPLPPPEVVETPLEDADPERLFDVALALEDHDVPAAIDVYGRLLELAPDHVEAHINLGRLLHEGGALDRAEEHYRRGLAIAPADPIAWFNLGVLLDDRELPTQAIDAYRASLKADPHNADAHFNLARLLERQGDELSALRHLTQYRQLRQ